MSELDVHQIICPAYERELMEFRRRRPHIEAHILGLRRMLREHDPSLPDEYDGNAWADVVPSDGVSTLPRVTPDSCAQKQGAAGPHA